ncbi:hypothetical protein EDB89DRAFT_1958987 [Lactarius sanguifluus]|nr:hypothetical protein EDB89DRAFT_1958987 [Lactarius sanguifluus]
MFLFGQPGAIELASIVSLMLAADSLVGNTMLPDVLDMFRQTLRIHSYQGASRPTPTSNCTVPRDIFQGSRLAQRPAAADIV